MFVNSIETTHKGSELEKGGEVAYFSFGSTVVLLFEKDIFQIESALRTPKEIKVGERIGVLRRR
jgi:phosphatidylserine decarboxylase